MDERETLTELRRLAHKAGAQEVVPALDTLSERVREGRFYVAVLGQFKRGKSTLVNALVGEVVLPVGVAPVTSVTTIVRHGARAARARIGDDAWTPVAVERVRELVSEQANPENRLGVKGVEVFLPAPILASGMCLVDTPGIGSVLAGNTAETRAFVPHVDAAVVVVGADPPISGEELALVTEVSERVRDVVFVLAKADRFRDEELAEARAFTTRVLEQRLGVPPVLFEVSVHELLDHETGTRDWDAFVGRLEALARERGAELVERAARRGARALAERLLADVDRQRRALTRPLDETRAELRDVRACIAEAEQALNELGFLLQAEHKSLSDRLATEQKRFVAEALPACRERLLAAFDALDERSGPKLRRAALGLAQDVAKPEVAAWMDRLRPDIQAMYQRLGRRFITHTNAFLARLRSGGRVPEGALDDLPEESGFRYRSRYYFYSFMSLATPSVFTWLADVVRPAGAERRAVGRDAAAFLERLLETNASRVVGDLDDRVLESRRQLEFEVRRRLRAVVSSAERALSGAEAAEREGQAGVERALARLDRTRAAVVAVLELLTEVKS